MDIDYVAKLARLNLKAEEKERFSKQIDDVLKYIKKLNQLDTNNVEPTKHIMSIKNVFREDKAKKSLNPELLKQIMPSEHDGFFKVPPVIE